MISSSSFIVRLDPNLKLEAANETSVPGIGSLLVVCSSKASVATRQQWMRSRILIAGRDVNVLVLLAPVAFVISIHTGVSIFAQVRLLIALLLSPVQSRVGN